MCICAGPLSGVALNVLSRGWLWCSSDRSQHFADHAACCELDSPHESEIQLKDLFIQVALSVWTSRSEWIRCLLSCAAAARVECTWKHPGSEDDLARYKSLNQSSSSQFQERTLQLMKTHAQHTNALYIVHASSQVSF